MHSVSIPFHRAQDESKLAPACSAPQHAQQEQHATELGRVGRPAKITHVMKGVGGVVHQVLFLETAACKSHSAQVLHVPNTGGKIVA